MSTRITCRIHPHARESCVMGQVDGVWKINVAAPAVEGRANRELIRFLSQILDVASSLITIERGTTSKTKVVQLSLSEEEIDRKLQQVMKQSKLC